MGTGKSITDTGHPQYKDYKFKDDINENEWLKILLDKLRVGTSWKNYTSELYMNEELKRKFVKRLIKINRDSPEIEIIDGGNTIQVKDKEKVLKKLQDEIKKDNCGK